MTKSLAISTDWIARLADLIASGDRSVIPGFKKLSIVPLAVTFIVVVCVSIVLNDLVRSVQGRQNALRESETAVMNLSRALAQHAKDSLKAADTALVGIVDRVQADPVEKDKLHRLLIEQAANLPQLQRLSIIDEQGHVVTTSQEDADGKPIDNSDREYFLFHRGTADIEPHLGPPIRARSTNEWIFTLSRRLNHADGSFAGVALASIRSDYFQRYYSNFDIGKGGAITISSRSGVVLARRPFRANLIGADLSQAPLMKLYALQTQEGRVTLESHIDGVVRVNAYRWVDDYPVVVVAAVSKDEILAEWEGQALYHGFVSLCLVAFLALMGTNLVKQIKERVAMQEEMRILQETMIAKNLELENLAREDGLTMLANRREFDRVLTEEVGRARRMKSNLAMLLIDVDHFKAFNDTYGHQAGDQCLRMVAHEIKTAVRRVGDLAARYGGEEIAMILPGADTRAALAVAQKLRHSIERLGVTHSGSSWGVVTVSVGVSTLRVDAQHMGEAHMIENADKALYEAKRSGRNQIMAFGVVSTSASLMAATAQSQATSSVLDPIGSSL